MEAPGELAVIEFDIGRAAGGVGEGRARRKALGDEGGRDLLSVGQELGVHRDRNHLRVTFTCARAEQGGACVGVRRQARVRGGKRRGRRRK